MNFEFRISNFEFWILNFKILNFEFWILNFEFQISNFEFWILNFEFPISNFKFWILNFEFHNFEFRILNFEFWISYFEFWILNFDFWILNFQIGIMRCSRVKLFGCVTLVNERGTYTNARFRHALLSLREHRDDPSYPVGAFSIPSFRYLSDLPVTRLTTKSRHSHGRESVVSAYLLCPKTVPTSLRPKLWIQIKKNWN